MIKTLGTFKFIRKHVPNQCKKQLYYAYVHSKIVYGIEVYGNTKIGLINKLQVLQNKALKILYRKDWYTSTNELHKELKLLKVVDMYNLSVLKFVHRCKMNNIPDVFRDYLRKK